MADRTPADWPEPWTLTAPEAYVLASGGNAPNDEPFKLAVKELVARRVLRADTIARKGWLRRGRGFVLSAGPRVSAGAGPVLAPVLDLYHRTRKRDFDIEPPEGSTAPTRVSGVSVEGLWEAAREDLGGPDRYSCDHVTPSLVEKGMVVQSGTEGVGFLLLKRQPKFALTSSGRTASTELEDWLRLGREHLKEWKNRDAARGAAYLERAGAAVLLMQDMQPELAALGQKIRSDDELFPFEDREFAGSGRGSIDGSLDDSPLAFEIPEDFDGGVGDGGGDGDGDGGD